MDNWISCNVFSHLVGIKSHGGQTALGNAANGGSWHGHSLTVRTVPGRGGASGKVYEVALSSLPVHLQLRYKELHGTTVPNRHVNDKATLEREFRYSLLQPILTMEKGSADRHAAILEICSRKHLKPNGKK